LDITTISDIDNEMICLKRNGETASAVKYSDAAIIKSPAPDNELLPSHSLLVFNSYPLYQSKKTHIDHDLRPSKIHRSENDAGMTLLTLRAVISTPPLRKTRNATGDVKSGINRLEKGTQATAINIFNSPTAATRSLV
jgi:hypothetical protein